MCALAVGACLVVVLETILTPVLQPIGLVAVAPKLGPKLIMTAPVTIFGATRIFLVNDVYGLVYGFL